MTEVSQSCQSKRLPR